jgi:hypothetical protein
MRAALCFLSWNRFQYTQKTIEFLLKNTNRDDYELIWWDNFSTEEEMRDWIRKTCIENKFSYLFFKKNEGLTRAMNNQMRIMDHMGKFDVFCHISNDVIVPEGWLDGVFEAIKSSKVGAVGLNLEEKITETVLIDGVDLEPICNNGCIGGMHYCIPKWLYDFLDCKVFKHVPYGYGQQDMNLSVLIKLLPMDVWDYYLPLKKYKGEEMGKIGSFFTDTIYKDYSQMMSSRLKNSGGDRNAGTNYRVKLFSYRAQYDAGLITAEQLIEKLKDHDEFLLCDKSQLLESNITEWIE